MLAADTPPGSEEPRVPSGRAKGPEPFCSPLDTRSSAPKSTKARTDGSRQDSHEPHVYGRKASSGSEELDEFSLEHGEVRGEPFHRSRTHFQAPKSSGGRP